MRKADYWLVALICAVAVCMSALCLNAKQGWHEDEISTYAMANGEYGGTISGYDDTVYGRYAFIKQYLIGDSFSEFWANARELLREARANGLGSVNMRAKYLAALSEAAPVWKSSDEYFKALTIQEDGRFNFVIPIINCALDNHPPLYYMLVTAASSLKADAFSPLFAYAVNLAFMLAAICVFYGMALRLTGKRALAVASTVLFAFCTGSMRLSVLFRMYEMLLFFCVCALSIHLRIRENNYELNSGDRARLISVTVLGFLTQYYYVVYAMFLAAVTLFKALKARRKQGAKRYARSVLISALIGVALWPFSIIHLLFSYRGVETAGNAASGGSVGRLFEFIKNALEGFMGGLWFMPLAVIALAFIIYLARRARGKRLNGALGFIVIPLVLYIVALSIIAPYTDFRYAVCALPAIVLLTCISIFACLSLLRSRIGGFIAICLCTSLALSGFSIGERDFLYPGLRKNRAFVDEYAGENCICFARRTLSFYPAVPDFLKYDEILVLTFASADALKTDAKAHSLDSVILYVDSSFNQAEALEYAMEHAGFTHYELLANPKYGMNYAAYYMTRVDSQE